nr:Gfo/Idh/MocA family oxidoreductase [Micromonospora sp. U21]
MTGPAALRLNVVGAGGFATFLTGVLRDLPDVAVTMVADPDTDRAGQLARTLAARAVPDWQALVGADDVDVVVVATPPASHAETTLAALRAGRHVFSEKPLATGEDDAIAVRDAVAATGRVLVVDHMLRYNPVLRALARLRDPRFARRPVPRPARRPTRCSARSGGSPSRTTQATRTSARSTGSGTNGPAAGSSSSTACTSSTRPTPWSARPPSRCRACSATARQRPGRPGGRHHPVRGRRGDDIRAWLQPRPPL